MGNSKFIVSWDFKPIIMMLSSCFHDERVADHTASEEIIPANVNPSDVALNPFNGRRGMKETCRHLRMSAK